MQTKAIRVGLHWRPELTPEVLYIRDLAVVLGKSPKALRAQVHRLMIEGRKIDLPRPFKIGRDWCWRREAIQAWLAAKESN